MLIAELVMATATALDASGGGAALGDGSDEAPSFGIDPSAPKAGTVAGSLVFGYADRTWRQTACDPRCTTEWKVADVTSGRVDVAWGVFGPVSLGLRAPLNVYAAGAAPGAGDVTVSAGLQLREGVLLTPALQLPTGREPFGEGRAVPSLAAGLGGTTGRFAYGVSAGARLGAPALGAPGGVDAFGAAVARVRVVDRVAVGPEIGFLSTSPRDPRGSALSLGASVRVHLKGLTLTAGTDHAIFGGVGTPRWRAFAGLGGSTTRRGLPAVVWPIATPPPAPPTDARVGLRVHVVDATGAVIDDASVILADGLPIPLLDGTYTAEVGPGTWTLRIEKAGFGTQTRTFTILPKRALDLAFDAVLYPVAGAARLEVRMRTPDGGVVEEATLMLDGLPLGTELAGDAFSVEGLADGPHQFSAWSPTLQAQPPVPIEPGDETLDLTLPWRPGTVHVRVDGPDGAALDAVVALRGPDRVEPVSLGEDGYRDFVLRPGPWDVLVSSPTLGMQARSLNVPSSGDPLDVRLVLQPNLGGDTDLLIRVVDPHGAPVVGAELTVDGSPYGTTANSGSAEILGLPVGDHVVQARLDGLEVALPVAVTSGFQEFALSLGRTPAIVDPALALRVSVTTPYGPAGDVVLRLASADGRLLLPALEVGADGEALVDLAPGEWDLLASSPQWGMLQRTVLVPAQPTPPDPVSLVFGSRRGPAIGDLLVRVYDPGHVAIRDATVEVTTASGATLMENTGRGGSALIARVQQGVAQVVVRAAAYDTVQRAVSIGPGAHVEVATLPWVAVPFEVSVRSSDGPVLAHVEARGPLGESIAADTSAQGGAELLLVPGTWSIVASAAGFGARQASVDARSGRLVLTLGEARVRAVPDGAQLRLVLADGVRFALDEASIAPASRTALADVADFLLSEPHLAHVQVQGHADASGDVAYNTQLSLRRAEAVREALIALGVPPERLSAQGYGAMRPVASNTTDPGRAANRRVEFVVIDVAVP